MLHTPTSQLAVRQFPLHDRCHVPNRGDRHFGQSPIFCWLEHCLPDRGVGLIDIAILMQHRRKAEITCQLLSVSGGRVSVSQRCGATKSGIKDFTLLETVAFFADLAAICVFPALRSSAVRPVLLSHTASASSASPCVMNGVGLLPVPDAIASIFLSDATEV